MSTLSIDDALVVAASRLAAVAPQEWEEFHRGLIYFAAQHRDRMIDQPDAHALAKAMGIAKGLKVLTDHIKDPVPKAAQILEKRK